MALIVMKLLVKEKNKEMFKFHIILFFSLSFLIKDFLNFFSDN